MNYAKYKNNKTWLNKDSFTTIYEYSKGKVLGTILLEEFRKIGKDPKRTFEKVLDEEAYKRMQKEYYEEESRCYNQFKQDLFEEYNVTNNPRAEKCFSMAWERGHSSGYESVANEFGELVELIQ